MALSRGKHLVKTSLQPDIPRKSRSRGLTPKEEAEWWIRAGLDKDGFRMKFISTQIGSGVFAMQEFKKGDFLMEYAGEHISPSEAEERRKTVYKRSKHHYIFHFRHEEKEKCIDATKQYQRLGRMVNDNEDTPNSRMKRIFLRGGRTPYLALFALSDIKIGDEITYDYGDPTAPWRNKEKTEESEMDDTVASRQPHKKRSVSAVTSDPDDLDDCVPDDTVPESPVKKKRKAVLSDLSDDCSQDDTCDTVTPSPVTKKRRIKRKKMADSDISDEEDVKATRSKPARRYFSWNEKDAGVVVRYFAKYIRDGGEGTKGCLPGKKEIEAFLECNPEVIESVRGGKECVGIIKAKVFNERSKRRAAVKKMKKTLNM